MFAILVIIISALGVWWMLSRTLEFAQGFGRLVERSQMRFGVSTLLTRRASVSGRFKDRRVIARLEQPFEHSPGRVLLAMEVRAPDGAPWKDASLTARNPDVSRATFDLEGRHELILTLTGGWLEAVWTPPPGALFPGRFDEGRWRNTLSQMQVLAEWLERHQAA
jgi:hypothetical protein